MGVLNQLMGFIWQTEFLCKFIYKNADPPGVLVTPLKSHR